MATNTLTGLIPVLYAGLNQVSRELVGFTRSVSMDSSAEQAAVGQTVTSPVVGAATTEDITPGVSPANSGAQTVGTVDMKITKAKASPIQWTGEEQMSVRGSLNTIMVDQVAESVRALVNLIEADLAGQYANLSRAVGTAAATPFGTASDFSDFANVRRVLENNGAPLSDLHLVLGADAAFNIRAKQSGLFEANRAGNEELLRAGTLGAPVEGLSLHQSGQIKTHTKGTGTGYISDLTAGYDIGDSTIHVDTGTNTILNGDVVTFADDTNKYLVTTGFAGDGDADIVIGSPGLVQALATDKAMTIGAGYTANMAFARSAIQLATRAPAMPTDPNSGKAMDAASDVLYITDPVSGLTFQVAIYAQYRRVKYEICIAWGTKVINANHGVVLMG